MVNVPDPVNIPALYFPTNGHSIEGPLVLAVRSTHDEGGGIELAVERWTIKGIFVQVEVEMPEAIHAGEWEYTLVSAAGVISSGIMMVGPMPADAPAVEYNRVIEYREYGNG